MAILALTQPAVAVAYDDDDGAGNMSWLHLNAAFGGRVVVGRYYASPDTGGTSLLWDEDIHRLDADADGLGAGLELALGTSDTDPDSDGDGIRDGIEAVGYDTASGPVELATWGARPDRPDLFVEADWNKCDVAADPGCGGDPDAYRLTPAMAEEVRRVYWGPESLADSGPVLADRRPSGHRRCEHGPVDGHGLG